MASMFHGRCGAAIAWDSELRGVSLAASELLPLLSPWQTGFGERRQRQDALRTMKSREEQLTWAKQRALICVDMGDFTDAADAAREIPV
jgi:hypothetical protein